MKPGLGKEGFSCRFQREHGAADPLISDFWSPETGETVNICFMLPCLWFFVIWDAELVPLLTNVKEHIPSTFSVVPMDGRGGPKCHCTLRLGFQNVL